MADTTEIRCEARVERNAVFQELERVKASIAKLEAALARGELNIGDTAVNEWTNGQVSMEVCKIASALSAYVARRNDVSILNSQE